MDETIDTLREALNRLDELTEPIHLDGDEGDLDAYLYALSKMAESAMERDALGEAHRLRDLQAEMERAEERGEPVDIRRSDALRLSVSLHTYREKLLDQDDEAAAEDVEQTIRVIDGKLEETTSRPEIEK